MGACGRPCSRRSDTGTDKNERSLGDVDVVFQLYIIDINALFTSFPVAMRLIKTIRVPDSEAFVNASIATGLFTVGALTAIVAWHRGMTGLLLILPLAWRYARCGKWAFMLMFGYFLAGADDFPQVFDSFFKNAYGWGIAIWLVHAAALALPYAYFRRYGAYGLLAALCISVLPPWGVIAWLSPLLLAGELFPGWGLAGYAACLLLFFGIAYSAPQGATRWILLMTLMLISIYCNGAAPSFMLNRLPLWFGQNTYLGSYPPDALVGLERQQQLMRQVDMALRQGAQLILLPEGIVGEWVPASEYWWKKEIDLARQRGATLLIGATQYEGSGLWANMLMLRGADNGNVKARVPVPIGMWNPFFAHGFDTHMLATGVVSVQGKCVAVSFCYEDTLVYPLALSFLRGQPAAILSSANNWFGAETDEPAMQARSIALQARLFGVPLIRALNLSALP